MLPHADGVRPGIGIALHMTRPVLFLKRLNEAHTPVRVAELVDALA